MMRPRLKPLYSLHRARILFEQCRKISSVNVSCPSSIPQSAYSFLSNRSLLAISGPDSTRYLHGAVTKNINSNMPNGVYTVFLNAQGRILNDVFIYPFQQVEGRYRGEQGWFIEVDSQEVELLVKRIKRYRLDSKFEIRAVPQMERSVWSVWSDKANETRIAQLLASSMNKSHPEADINTYADRRAPGMGYRLLLPGNKKPELDLEQCHTDCYRVRRYLKGVPEGQNELIKEHALPQESNVDLMGGIDYRKGCYVGQELTIRTYHTGVVRKRILPLQIYDVDEEEPMSMNFSRREYGTERIPLNTNICRWKGAGRSTGKWLAGMGNIGLGLCRLANMTEITVRGETRSSEIEEKFKVEWESSVGKKTVMVKAFTPEWLEKTCNQI